jgi:2'-5' RNA ligase
MPGDCILVYFLSEQSEGFEFKRTRNDWPMHITLVPWFVTDAADLDEQLQNCAREAAPFDVVLGDEAQFNPDTRVTIPADTQDISQLHDQLLKCVEASGGKLRTDRWIRESYKAHVTHHDSQPIPRSGDTYRVDSFSMVTLLPGNRCKVTQRFPLGAGDETAA